MSLLMKWCCLEVYIFCHAHTNMQVSDIPVQKNELAVWAIVVYIYSLDLRACAVFFETLVLILVFVMLLSALLDCWSHMRGS